MGTEWLSAYRRELESRGCHTLLRKVGPGVWFGFGGDNKAKTLGLYEVPAYPYGELRIYSAYLIKGASPYLLSISSAAEDGLEPNLWKKELRRYGVLIDFGLSSVGHWVVPFLPGTSMDPSAAAGVRLSSQMKCWNFQASELRKLFRDSVRKDPYIVHLLKVNRRSFSLLLGFVSKKGVLLSSGAISSDVMEETPDTKRLPSVYMQAKEILKAEFDFEPYCCMLLWNMKFLSVPRGTVGKLHLMHIRNDGSGQSLIYGVPLTPTIEVSKWH